MLIRDRFFCSGYGFVNENLPRLGVEFTETFVMLTAIQAERFLVDINSERNNHVGYFEQQQGTKKRIGCHDHQGQCMEQKCLCLAVDQSDFAREYSGRQHAHHPADTVTGEDIQRIVQIGFRLPMNRNVAKRCQRHYCNFIANEALTSQSQLSSSSTTTYDEVPFVLGTSISFKGHRFFIARSSSITINMPGTTTNLGREQNWNLAQSDLMI